MNYTQPRAPVSGRARDYKRPYGDSVPITVFMPLSTLIFDFNVLSVFTLESVLVHKIRNTKEFRVNRISFDLFHLNRSLYFV